MKEAKEYKNDTFGFPFDNIDTVEDHKKIVLTTSI
jgi:hypothetical protein